MDTMLTTKKGFIGIISFVLLSISTITWSHNTALTYRFDGSGRFGDCVMIYCKAKYGSLHYGLPLYYKPFRHSELLALHTKEQPLTNMILLQIPNHTLVSSFDDLNPNLNNTLFISDLYTMLAGKQPTDPTVEVIPIPEWMNFWPDEIYALMQTDTHYKEQIHAMLTPARSTSSLATTIGSISVAIHIRKGGSADLPHYSPQLFDKNHPELYHPLYGHPKASDKKFPLRFPPEQYYIDMLNQLATLVDPLLLSVTLFTDDMNSHLILEHFVQQCTASNIHFAGIYCSPHFIDDLARIAQADCLIRPCSHFSGTAQLMGNHKLIIRPQHAIWADPLLIITASNITLNDNSKITSVAIGETIPITLQEQLKKIFGAQQLQQQEMTDDLMITVKSTAIDALASDERISPRVITQTWDHHEQTVIMSLVELLTCDPTDNVNEKTLKSLENEAQEQERISHEQN